MNYLALVNFQRIIFSIIFILSGLYLIIFFIKEIIMLFIPSKPKIELSDFLMDRNIKILPITTEQPKVIKENINKTEYVKPEVIKKEYKSISPTVIKVKKEKKEKKKSRKRKDND